MDFLSINHWDPVLWNLVDELYQEAFGKNGAKPVSIIQNMFEKQLCVLHLMLEGNEAVAMSLTGAIPSKGILIIDYLAVNKDRRLKQYGWNMVDYIKKWAMARREYSLILLEAECDKTADALVRISFWEKCGFELLGDYIHQYIWVPETYQAMRFVLQQDSAIPATGKELFKYIVSFHKESYRHEK